MKYGIIYFFLTVCVVRGFAADLCNQFEIVLYGRVWQVTSYFVQDDLAVNPNRDMEMLEPDGIACRLGYLYVSGDREEWNTNSRLAIYSWQNNLITYTGYRQMPTVSPNWWGPDGLTFNTSGDPNSYGSGVNDIVSVESDAPAQIGLINKTTGVVTGKMPIAPAEDIAYIESTGKFATVASSAEESIILLYNKNLSIQESHFAVIGQVRGLAWMSNDFGQWFVRKAVSSNEGFLLAASKESANKLAIYDMAGNLVGLPQELPITPKARIPLGGGLTQIEPAFGQIEAVAIDPQSKTILIGDHGSAMIHVLAPVRLAGDIDKNGSVDLSDMAALAVNWLSTACGDPQWCNGADTQHSKTVDLWDFAVVAEQLGQSFTAL